jgi:hypothetical protein
LIGEDDRQSYFPAAEIVPDALADTSVVSRVVERIVDELEGEAEIEPIRREGGALLDSQAGQCGNEFGRRRKKGGRLCTNHRHVLIFARRKVFLGAELHDLTRGHLVDRGGQDVESIQRSYSGHHPQCLAEQEVTDMDTGTAPPDRTRRRRSTTHLGSVHDVIMQQRCCMYELHRCRQGDVVVAPIAGEIRGGKRQHRTQPLAARFNQLACSLTDRRNI